VLQGYFSVLFIRKLKNRSGSISVQVICKDRGRYKVIKSFGAARTSEQEHVLVRQAEQYIDQIQGTQSLFVEQDDIIVESFVKSLSNTQIHVVGPELIFGRIYDFIGFDALKDKMFRHLVLTRLFHPGSKLKAIDYLHRYLGIDYGIDSIYRFLDKLGNSLQQEVESISFRYIKRVLRNKISIVFYDMTTLHFESSDEDDLRRTGFSKVGKHQNPQIYLGLLIGLEGHAIGYEIFEGNIFEGHTLIPVLEKFEKRFDLGKPIVVADAGLLTSNNLALLEQLHYQYIIGARIKNESKKIKDKIVCHAWEENKPLVMNKGTNQRLIVSYSKKRAKKDAFNRERGLKRLEKKIKSKKLTKANINNRGYNKYLKLTGKVDVSINYEKYEADAEWDGLKGYLTNSTLKPVKIIDNYRQLWQIERAFRISKTDLRIRPIYHRLKHRIEAHICISFTAYCIYRELERILKNEKSSLSIKRAAELTHNMYQLDTLLPKSKKRKAILLKMDQEQSELYNIVVRNF
jgi:transposase